MLNGNRMLVNFKTVTDLVAFCNETNKQGAAI